MTSRRLVLSQSAALLGAASTGLLLPETACAQPGKIRVGLMLPYTGTYAQLGVAIENGFRMAVDEQGGKLGGREIEYFKVDDESDPSKGVENASKLVQRDKVDVLIGTVHSGVALAMAKVARENKTLLIVPNAVAEMMARSGGFNVRATCCRKLGSSNSRAISAGVASHARSESGKSISVAPLRRASTWFPSSSLACAFKVV